MNAPEPTAKTDAAFDQYQSPFSSRYAGKAMRALFSERTRIQLWRKLWCVLAQEQRELGLDLPKGAIDDLGKRIADIDFARAADLEKSFRHEVMAHLSAFAELSPAAGPFLHLGATSCYITDNADLILMRTGLDLVRGALVLLIEKLAAFADQHRGMPTLGYTHFQPAQPTTVGKRACLWIQDLLLDLEEVSRLRDFLPLRGAKGTTGTQASFLSLFKGDHNKVKELDHRIALRLGFERTFAVTGQTYSRKVDSRLLCVLAGVGESCAKAGNDLRLLAHEREVEEPYESQQIGSSAMAYKRNPMRSERMCSIARFLMHLPANGFETTAQQWLERSLDDSANRRIVLSEAFLAADAVLRIYHSIASGLIVNEPVIRAHLKREIPFLCTEELLLQAAREGGDRQLLHERIRIHSRAAVERLKGGASDNDLFDRLKADPALASVHGILNDLARGENLVGRAPEQVTEFLENQVKPLLARTPRAEVNVEDLHV